MTALFLTALLTSLGVRFWLSFRHERHVVAHRGEVPAAFAEKVPLDAHQKAADYTVARVRFGRLALVWRALLLLAFTLGGGIDLLAGWFRSDALLMGVGFLLTALFATELLQLPFAIYRTFVIEERFGFNRTKPRLFVLDLFKQALLGGILGGALACGALWLVRDGGTLWWLWLWLGWVTVSLFLSWIYPTVIAPLFHKFTRLDDKELSARLAELLQRTGFRARGIYVMDGSRRSTHANAYFTGFGAKKRIVLFDTLRDMLGDDEIEAVLAHELGHFKLKHIWWGLALGAGMGLAGLVLFALLIERPWFYAGLGVREVWAPAGLLLFSWVAPLFTFPLRPFLSAWSRRHEYEADSFAATHADGASLGRALVKMYEHNAATLTPDPLHSAFHDSHPPAALRVARLSAR